MKNIETMLEAVKSSSPAKFTKALSEEIALRLQESIKDRKAEVISELFGKPDDSEGKSDDEGGDKKPPFFGKKSDDKGDGKSDDKKDIKVEVSVDNDGKK